VSPAASASTSHLHATDLGRLLGLPFDDSDEVIQAGVAAASIFDYWRWTNRPDPDDYELRR
jgi:hypothetical protein